MMKLIRQIQCRLLARGSFMLLAAIVLGVANVQAQTDVGSSKPKPPPGPLLNMAPSPGQWTINYSYPEDRAKTPTIGPAPGQPPPPDYLGKRPRTITATKSRDMIREETVDLKGSSTVQWYMGNTLYYKPAGEPLWLQVTPGSNGAATDRSYSPLPASGFRDLNWLDASNYLGTVRYGGRSCLIFFLGAPKDLDLNRPDLITLPGEVAFIDAETRLPVQTQVDGVVRVYQFSDAPDGFVLPADLAAQLKMGTEVRARLDMR